MSIAVSHSVNDEWHFQDHLLSKTISLKALSQKRPEQWICTTDSSQGSLRNSLFKTIFQVQLSYWLKVLSPERNRTLNTQSRVFLSVTDKQLFNTIFWIKLLYQLKALSPRGPEQWMCRGFPCVTNEWPFQDHLLSKTTSFKALSPGRPEQWTWRVVISVTEKQPFQDHLFE